VKPFRIEQANAIGQREPARDAHLELGHLTVEVACGQALTQQPDHRRQMVRPTRFDVRRVSLRAIAPAVSGFHGLAFLRGGMIAVAPRAAMAS